MVSGAIKSVQSEDAKAMCLDQFMSFAQDLDQQRSCDCFFDYVDPSSGLLMNSNNMNVVYSEILGVETFLQGKRFGFKTVQMGLCRGI